MYSPGKHDGSIIFFNVMKLQKWKAISRAMLKNHEYRLQTLKMLSYSAGRLPINPLLQSKAKKENNKLEANISNDDNM